MYATEENLIKENKIIKYSAMFLRACFTSLLLTIFIGLIIGFRPFVVTSGSMSPNILQSDMIIVYKPSQDKIQIGDVITYKTGLKYCTHRVVEISEDGEFITRGDANNADDNSAVSYSEIAGKVYYNLGYLPTAIIFNLSNLISLFLGIGFLVLFYQHTKPKKIILEL